MMTKEKRKIIVFVLIFFIMMLLFFTGIKIVKIETRFNMLKQQNETDNIVEDTTIITYTTVDPEGYTNQNSMDVIIEISNPIGIKSIQKVGENTVIYANGKKDVKRDYKITKNETHTFKVVSKSGKEEIKDIYIGRIDKIEPKDFIPSIENITIDGFTVVANAEDGDATEESVKSGIKKYDFYVNNTKYQSNKNKCVITELKKNTEYDVYVIAYDRAGNSKKSNVIKAKTGSVLYPPVAKITFNEENATKKVADYPMLTMSGMKNCILEPNEGEEVILEITSLKSDSVDYCYSDDGGIHWYNYTEPIKISYKKDNLIDVKSVSKNSNVESDVQNVKKYVSYDNELTCAVSESLPKTSYDNDLNTYSSGGYFRIDSECWGKYLNIDCVTKGDYIYKLYGWITVGTKNGRWDNPLANYLVRLTGIDVSKHCIRSLKLPENSFWGYTYSGTGNMDYRIYEIWCGEQDLTGKINQ